ncbi:MAG: hypothetical protein Q4Q04_04845, partial [Methanocorpusculum sp.]|nr:hypothetical protein [Methanocorpusculum sp.]
GYQERCDLYHKIEKCRNRPLIAYVTSSRANDGAGQIGADVIPEFCDQLLKIPDTEKNIDLLIVSNGGDPIVSWRIISILRERFEKIGVLVPFAANSAATLLALGADEIIMHPFANFGPVDPQLNVISEGGYHQQFSADYITNYLDFVKNEVGITEQEELGIAFQHLCEKVSALDIGLARKSTNLTESLGKKLLSPHIESTEKAEKIASILTKSFHHHGYTIGRAEAVDLGLPIIPADKELEMLLWDVWKNFETEMKCRIPFDPITEVITTPEYANRWSIDAQNPLTHVSYENILNALPPNGYVFSLELRHAALESTRMNSEYISLKQFTIQKTPDLKLNYILTPISNGYWRESK